MSNPFDDYKDKVDYNYILEVKMKYKLEGGNEEQQLEALEGIEKQIDNLIANEDYNKMCFDDVEVGLVYPRLDRIDETLDMTFGICVTDPKVTLDDLKGEAEEYMYVLDSNIDGVGVTGWDDGQESVEPATVYLKTSRDIDIKVVKQPKKESFDVSNMDKKLVSEGVLTFKLNESIKSLVLNDDGQIEKYEEGKLIESLPFAKRIVASMATELLENGYTLTESEVKSSDGQVIDTEKEKERLEQADKDVTEIQQMKQAIEDKVDELVEENKTFESTDYTKSKLSLNTLKQKPMKECLTPGQQDYIIAFIGDLDSFINGFEDLYTEVPVQDDEELLSVDDYINYLLGGNQ